MSEEVSKAISPLERVFLAVPGGAYPAGRAAMGAAAGLGVMYFLRPSMSFFSDGTARPWIVTNWNDAEATVFPWWAYPALPAVIFGILL